MAMLDQMRQLPISRRDYLRFDKDSMVGLCLSFRLIWVQQDTKGTKFDIYSQKIKEPMV